MDANASHDRFELEAGALYAAAVAGMAASRIKRAIGRFLAIALRPGELPFEAIRRLAAGGTLRQALEGARLGKYSRLTRTFGELAQAGLDLRTCDVEDLEQIHGIGPKTARFFLLWTRPGVEVAALDVHVLRWLRHLGYKAPRQTPVSSRTYARLERVFLQEAARRGLTARELDFRIWEWCSRGNRDGWPPPLERTGEQPREAGA